MRKLFYRPRRQASLCRFPQASGLTTRTEPSLAAHQATRPCWTHWLTVEWTRHHHRHPAPGATLGDPLNRKPDHRRTAAFETPMAACPWNFASGIRVHTSQGGQSHEYWTSKNCKEPTKYGRRCRNPPNTETWSFMKQFWQIETSADCCADLNLVHDNRDVWLEAMELEATRTHCRSKSSGEVRVREMRVSEPVVTSLAENQIMFSCQNPKLVFATPDNFSTGPCHLDTAIHPETPARQPCKTPLDTP